MNNMLKLFHIMDSWPGMSGCIRCLVIGNRQQTGMARQMDRVEILIDREPDISG